MLVNHHLQNVGTEKGKTMATPNSTFPGKVGVSPPSVCSFLFLYCRCRPKGSGEGVSGATEQGVWGILVIQPSLVVVDWEGTGDKSIKSFRVWTCFWLTCSKHLPPLAFAGAWQYTSNSANAALESRVNLVSPRTTK